MRLGYFFIANLALVLGACSSLPQSYLPSGEKPIVNIEEQVASKLSVNATSEKLEVTNLSEQALNIHYKLFWYDIEGVTQDTDSTNRTAWLHQWLAPKEKQQIALNKPTPESAKYRFYVRGQ